MSGPTPTTGDRISAKLGDRARNAGLDAQSLRLRYVLERLLWRLERTGATEHFELKGALSVLHWTGGSFSRPTEDMDLNGSGEPESAVERIRASIEEAARLDGDDGVAFEPDSITVRKIREGIVAGGKIELTAHLGQTRLKVRVDAGLGNPMVPEPEERQIPALVEGYPGPTVRLCPLETTIAEKLSAAVRHGMFNTRVKDAYDLWHAANSGVGFDGGDLAEALRRTMEHQRLEIPEGVPDGLSEAWAAKNEKAWRKFLKSKKLEAPDLGETMATVRSFALPALEAARGDAPEPGEWEPENGWTPKATPKP